MFSTLKPNCLNLAHLNCGTVPVVLLQKSSMQSDGWPEMPQLSEDDLYNEEGLLEAKTIITNWTKDLRAQPEVRRPKISCCGNFL